MPAMTQSCHLLSLPDELRNRIYELCFTQSAREVNLIEAQPPSKDLLCKCRQVYDEARLMHRQAYRDYWSKTWFVLHLRTDETYDSIRTAYGTITSIGEADIRHISLIRIENKNGHQVWTFRDGLWHYWDTDDTGQMDLVYVELWVAAHHEDVFRSKGYEVIDLTNRHWTGIQVLDASNERIEEAKGTAGKQGLSKEEFLMALDEE